MQKNKEQTRKRLAYLRKVNAATGQNKAAEAYQEPPTLERPKTPVWWGGDPDYADLIPREQQDTDMAIKVKVWPKPAPAAGTFDTFTFEWKVSTSEVWTPLPSQTFEGPIDPNGPDIDVTLSKEVYRQHGVYDIRYRVREWTGLGEAFSFNTRIVVDREAPNHNGESPAAPQFDDPSLVDGITGDYLDKNPEVMLYIPPYHDEQATDFITVYVDAPGIPSTLPVFLGHLLLPARTVVVPASELRKFPDGLIYVTYRLQDMIGNLGQPSARAETSLLINPLPTVPLARPIVELAEDDGLINLEDVRTTTKLVAVELYDNWIETDRVQVTWGGVAVPAPHTVGSEPSDPIIIDIPYASVLQPAYGVGTKGPKSTTVSYQVIRGKKPFDSAPFTLNVDLSVPGPINPERPKPVNPNLPKLTVYGNSDTGKANPNKLVAEDFEKDATADVLLYNPIAAGEKLWFYWGSEQTLVHEYEPPVGDEGKSYVVPIPWAKIIEEPASDQVRVFYEVGLASGAGNREMSEDTYVDVTEALPIILAEPDFPDKGHTEGSGIPILNCNSYLLDVDTGERYLRVAIDSNSGKLTAGEEVTFELQGYMDIAESTPLPDTWSVTREVTQAEIDNGIDLIVPYLSFIEPIGILGSVKVSYRAVDAPVRSSSVSIWASTTRSGGACWLI